MAHVPSRIRKKIEWLLGRAEGALLPDGLLAAEGAHLEPAQALEKLVASKDEVALVGASERVEQLVHVLGSAGDADRRRAYVEHHGVAGVRRFHGGKEARVYLLSVETFPRHVNNVYLVLEPGHSLLFDCGSGFDSSRRDIALGFAVVRAVFGESVRFEEVDVCVISHAHMDHFGGANVLKKQSIARLAVHELDARVLACFDERLVVASKDIDVFWRRAGASDADRARMLGLYTGSKHLFVPQEVDRVLRDGDIVGPGYRVHHVPGHCPGLICLQVHDVLLTSDHVLARITPHQFPQAITPFAGLEHYFRSLAKVRRLEGLNYALGGHEEPIWDLRARIDDIALFHRDRLARVLEVCKTPRTILGVTRELFGEQEGYGAILAIEEAGAHVEYLHQLGKLRIANLDAVARSADPVIEYVARG
jgi:glyoxylase-like metal-dependent hydrolase (beta-lactamase superfamily II)